MACLGDLTLDIVVRAGDAVDTGTDVPASIRFRAGGSAANTARSFARAASSQGLFPAPPTAPKVEDSIFPRPEIEAGDAIFSSIPDTSASLTTTRRGAELAESIGVRLIRKATISYSPSGASNIAKLFLPYTHVIATNCLSAPPVTMTAMPSPLESGAAASTTVPLIVWPRSSRWRISTPVASSPLRTLISAAVARAEDAVSYTHLTLPTILRV